MPDTSSHRSQSLNEQIEHVHWHLVRSDSQRAGVASRAGALLSTNAIVIAGIALTLGLKSDKPGLVVTILAIFVLICVAISVMNASLAIVTIFRFTRQFPMHQVHVDPPYSFAELKIKAVKFDDFMERMAKRTSEQVFQEALAELWRCGVMHGYRFTKLRVALRWLLAALCLFLITVTLSALGA